MAQQTSALSRIAWGVNETDRRYFHAFVAAAAANNDTILIQLPTAGAESMVGENWVPQSVMAGVYTAGAGGLTTVGQRTFTPAALSITSYDESTGKLILTNATGGSLTGLSIVITFMAGKES
jgi:hypothetical protein